jgi:peptidoglycan/LPS O-acetylase OafA/YrhL
MVVGLHGGFLGEISQEGNFLTVQGVFRIAVPIFFIMSGYYFTSVSNTERLVKWIKRVLSLYTFWMVFYIYFWFRPDSLSVIDLIKVLKTVIVGHHHLWYLSAMIGAGVLTFLLRRKPALGIVLSFVLFIAGVAIQYLGNYHLFSTPMLDKIMNYTFIHRNFLFLGFPFFYIGFVINGKSLFKDVSLKLLVIISILGVGLLLGESWYNYSNPLNDGGFDNYLSLFLICPTLFLLANRAKFTTKDNNLALISTAIYLIHPFWLSVLRKFTLLEGTLITLACILLSLLSAYAIIKIQKRVAFIL